MPPPAGAPSPRAQAGPRSACPVPVCGSLWSIPGKAAAWVRGAGVRDVRPKDAARRQRRTAVWNGCQGCAAWNLHVDSCITPALGEVWNGCQGCAAWNPPTNAPHRRYADPPRRRAALWRGIVHSPDKQGFEIPTAHARDPESDLSQHDSHAKPRIGAAQRVRLSSDGVPAPATAAGSGFSRWRRLVGPQLFAYIKNLKLVFTHIYKEPQTGFHTYI